MTANGNTTIRWDRQNTMPRKRKISTQPVPKGFDRSGLRRCSQCGAMALRGSTLCKWHQPDYVRSQDRGKARLGQIAVAGYSGIAGQPGQPGGHAGPVSPSYDGIARKTLLSVARDVNASATARTHAARALAELDGYLGKHQQAPERTADSMLSSLSRGDLVRELARLRARCAGDSAA